MFKKLVDDLVSKLVTEAPTRTIQFLTGAAVTRRRLRTMDSTDVRQFLYKFGSLVWREGVYVFGQSVEYEGKIPVFWSTKIELFWYRKAPILVRKVEVNNHPDEFEISAFRGTIDLDLLLKEVAKGSKTRLFRVRTHSGKGFGSRNSNELCAPKAIDSDDIAITNQTTFAPPLWESPALKLMLEEGRRWRQSRKWCLERGLPWKHAWLLHGPPGNGKTSCARAVAQDLEIPLHNLLLSSMTDQDFLDAWQTATNDTPSLVLIEDFDDTIRGRQNIRCPNQGVSFSTILNCLDGASRSQGTLLVMTTNDVSAIDPAIGQVRETTDSSLGASRPGRIDRVVRVDAPTLEGRLHIARNIFREDEEEVRRLAEAGEGMSLAQFQFWCQDEALTKYWAT